MSYKEKSLLTLTLATLLCGCGTTVATNTGVEESESSDNATIVEPANTIVVDESDGFTEEAINYILQYYEDDEDALHDIYTHAGMEVGDYTFTTVTGETINTSDWEGKKVLIELIADTCTHCQSVEQNFLDDILKIIPDDVTYVQMFGSGDSDGITSFLDTYGHGTNTDYPIITCDSEVTRFGTDIELEYFPSWIYIDETGTINWFVTGEMDADEVSMNLEAAFSGTKVYDGKSNSSGRTYEDVKADLTDEAVSAVDEINNGNEYFEETLYSMLSQDISSEDGSVFFVNDSGETDTETTYDLNEVISGKYVVLFVPGYKTEYITDEFISDYNKMIEEKNLNSLVVYFVDDEEEFLTYYQGLETRFTGYSMRTDTTLVPLGLDNLKIYWLPTAFFVDENNVVAGVYTGTWTTDDFESAYNLFLGDNPLYSQVK